MPKTSTDLTARLRLASLMLAVASPGAAAPGVEAPRTIRVVMDDAYAPFTFQSADGKLQGILIDQWQAWEKKTGIKAEIHAMDWDAALRRMLAGEFDVIDSIVETAERRDYFDFTPAYATIEASIFFRNDISGITDLESLKGFPVGVKTGDQHIDHLRANGVTTVILFPNNDAIVAAAKQHKINVFVVDDPSALYLLNKMDIEGDFRHSAPIFRDELRRAVRKGDAATLRTVSEGFAAIEPGRLKQIDEKWFGRTINRFGRYLTYAGYAAAAAILLIGGLAGWNRTLRKRILLRTAALGESEQRFRQIAENIHEVFWLIDVTKQRLLYVSPAFEDIWGRTCASLYAAPMGWLDAVHPDDRERVRQAAATRQSIGAYDEEYRVIRSDESVGWIHDRAFPVRNAAGEVYRIAGVAEDVTERKRAEFELRAAEQQLHALVGRLHTAREEEAERIARELHDDLGQLLTGLLFRIEGHGAGAGNPKDEIRGIVNDLIDRVRDLSMTLRPPMLDDLGLLSALTWQIERFEAQTGIRVRFHHAGLDRRFSAQLEITAFRIVQEALTNAARHAGVRQAKVDVWASPVSLGVRIEDEGRGFDVEAALDARSSGLEGMRERSRLVGGRLVIESEPGKGARLSVELPLDRGNAPTKDEG